MHIYLHFHLILTFLILIPFVIGQESGKPVNMTEMKATARFVNTNTYTLEGFESKELFRQGRRTRNRRRKNYYIKNIGEKWIFAYPRVGTTNEWVKTLDSVTAKQGILEMLDPSQDYDRAELVVTNYKEFRCFFQAYMGESYPMKKKTPISWNINLDMNELIKTLVVFGAGHIPTVGPILSEVIGFFWPSTTTSAWDEVKEHVIQAIDDSITELINNLLNNKINVFKRRLQMLLKEQERNISKRLLAPHYINIAQDMIGLEEEFAFKGAKSEKYRNMKFAVLPIFSMMVSMKALFYRCGLQNPEALGLTEDELGMIQTYAFETLDPEIGIAYKHVREVEQEKLEKTYATVEPDNLFNEMANIKSYISFNGERYMAVWQDILQGSPAKGKPHNPALLYPSFLGIATADLLLMGGRNPPLRPLTPNMKNGKRVKIVKLNVHTYNSNAVGIDVIYNDESVMSSGRRKDTEVDKFNIEPQYIQKLVVWGDFPNGFIRGLKFITDGNNTYQSGTKAGSYFIYEMQLNHIAAIHMSNDMGNDTTKAWNIAVSFQADSIYHD